MKSEDKQEYLQLYEEAKKKGIPFYPDAIFKDAVVSFLVFLALVALSAFVGVPLEEPADPADTTYTPRPDWYFLFLFQLLKYFPGSLEVVGVIIFPLLVLALLLALPYLDRSPRRHFLRRPAATAGTALFAAAFAVLTVVALLESPPPAEPGFGDEAAALYAANCAGCHGPGIAVPVGIDLHGVIAEGTHDGMPPWSADLSTDEIDALAGFILSPDGSRLFTASCGDCHAVTELAASDPFVLRDALEQGSQFPSHANLDIPEWAVALDNTQRTALINFLVAPDGQRLFATNCASCHGTAVAFSGDFAALRTLIAEGGLHLDMPRWVGRLSEDELTAVSRYAVDPGGTPEGQEVFRQHCVSCHGDVLPEVADFEQAYGIIAEGEPHRTMPVWGEVLTPEQLDALTTYALEAARGSPQVIGQQLYTQYCSSCHGDFGEGGPHPANPGNVLAPISTEQYLSTHDDVTLRAVVSQGQPDSGMSPFGIVHGGPLDTEQVDAVVAFIRSWELNPPVELPPELAGGPVAGGGDEVFAAFCAQCHGAQGEGGIGPAFDEPAFQEAYTDQEIFDTIRLGHLATSMIAWGEVLTSSQIQQLVTVIRSFGEEPSATPTFVADVLPIFRAKCNMCHGTAGGWDGTTYQRAINSGDNGPAIVPGNADASLLFQKLLGTQTIGGIMPPQGALPDNELLIISDWITAGAPER